MNTNKIKDNVNHPEHYISSNGIEVIDVIDQYTYGLRGYEAVYTANIIKYVCRWKHKNGIEDLKKAQWYLNRLIYYKPKVNKFSRLKHRHENYDEYHFYPYVTVMEVINAFTSELNGSEAIYTATIIDLICQWKYKNGLKDLEKASWNLRKLIDEATKEENDPIEHISID